MCGRNVGNTSGFRYSLGFSSLFANGNIMLTHVHAKGLLVSLRQQVNMRKIVVLFRRNTTHDGHEMVRSLFHIQNDGSHDKYLRLPTIIERNKLRHFQIIKDGG